MAHPAARHRDLPAIVAVWALLLQLLAVGWAPAAAASTDMPICSAMSAGVASGDGPPAHAGHDLLCCVLCAASGGIGPAPEGTAIAAALPREAPSSASASSEISLIEHPERAPVAARAPPVATRPTFSQP